MTFINFTGKKWIGAGLVCREPGRYRVSDELAEFLTANHPDKFELADVSTVDDAPDSPDSTESDAEGGSQESSEDAETVETAEEAQDESELAETHSLDTDVDSNQGEGPATEAETTNSEDVETTGTENVKSAEGESASDEPEATQEPSEEATPTESLSKMNRNELEAEAARIGLEVTEDHATNKDLAEAIKAYQS